MIEAKIICDSLAPCGKRLTTYVLTYPWSIHPQLLTHRVFSRNSQSARAMPIAKMVERCLQNPAIPERWGRNGKGMQPKGDLPEYENARAKYLVENLMDKAISCVERLEYLEVHKEQTNRYLLPFSHITTILSGTEFDNFFAQRVHADAQHEIQDLAGQMLGLYLTNEPKQLKAGEWHVPFGDRYVDGLEEFQRVQVATGRIARVSYMTFDGSIDTASDMRLHNDLWEAPHPSPFEHCAMASSEPTRSNNFIGFCQYRELLDAKHQRGPMAKPQLQAIYDKWKEGK